MYYFCPYSQHQKFKKKLKLVLIPTKYSRRVISLDTFTYVLLLKYFFTQNITPCNAIYVYFFNKILLIKILIHVSLLFLLVTNTTEQ